MPEGPPNTVLERGQINDGPAIEQPGSGATDSTKSSVSVHPFSSTTVRRKVAVTEETCAVVIKDAAESIAAIPETTLQAVEAIGWIPAVATPRKGNAVTAPSVHRV